MTHRYVRTGRSVGIALLLAGGSLGPAYRSPDLEIPAAFRATSVTAAQAWPRVDWWHGFGSSELDALIAQAETGSFDIQAAIARVTQADAQVRISGSPLLPTMTGSGSWSWQYSGGGSFSSSSSSRSSSGRAFESRSYSLGPA